jgi:creatinine amidohydrolase
VIRLADLTWPEARRVARDARSVVLLPLGAVEQHGPHLPLSVDWLGA